MKVLIVEDSPTQLEALRFLLEESGYAVVAATNGANALEAAKAYAIDLVISDVVMPEMDGYALCRALRADDALRHLPVILLTSLTDPQDVIRGLESGVNNLVYKPYEDRALLARVKTVLANQGLRRTAPEEMKSVIFAGQRFFITAERLQILDLLLSTYENAVQRNAEVVRTRDEMRVLNEQLAARAAERTAALGAEIEEHKRAEAELHTLRQAVNASGEAIFMTDRDGIITAVNPEFSRLYGYSAGEVVGKSTPGILKSESTLPEAVELFWRNLLGKHVVRGELVNKAKDGRLLTVRSSVRAILDGEGNIVGFLAIQRDVTAEKRLEAEFRQA